MSFQAYLDAIERQTGRTPRELIEMAEQRGFGEATKSGEIVDWLKEDFGLGRGHAMALVHVIKRGPGISDKHVDSKGVHRDESDVLYLDGIAARSREAAEAERRP
jgi:hypothetical protein